MDTSKLKNLLADLVTGSEKNIVDTLATLVSNIGANQSSEISDNLSKIKEHFNNSFVNNYSPSNTKVLEEIGALKFFGTSGFSQIEKILNESLYNVQKTVTELQLYLKKRNDFIALIKATNDNLEKLNIDSHFHSDDIFEVGLLMPKEFTQDKIVNITKELNRWDKVFKTLKELTGSSPEDTEINFISNGSLQFFIDNSPHIAACLAVTIERVVKLYKNIVEIRIAKEKLKELGISSGEQRSIEKQEKDLFTKEIEKISSELIKQFASKKIETGRMNELKIAMKGHVIYVAKCINNGMTIEINPPEIAEPDELEENDTKEDKDDYKILKNNYDKTLKQIEVVQKSMEAVKSIGKIGFDVVKLLSNEEIDTDEE